MEMILNTPVMVMKEIIRSWINKPKDITTSNESRRVNTSIRKEKQAVGRASLGLDPRPWID